MHRDGGFEAVERTLPPVGVDQVPWLVGATSHYFRDDIFIFLHFTSTNVKIVTIVFLWWVRALYAPLHRMHTQ